MPGEKFQSLFGLELGGDTLRLVESRSTIALFQSLFGLELGGDLDPRPPEKRSRFQSLFGLELGGDVASRPRTPQRRVMTTSPSFNPCLGWNWGGTDRSSPQFLRRGCGFNPCLGWNWGGTLGGSANAFGFASDMFQSLFGLELGGDADGVERDGRASAVFQSLFGLELGGDVEPCQSIRPKRRGEGFNPCLGWNWGGTARHPVRARAPKNRVSILVWVGIGGGPSWAARTELFGSSFNPCLGWNWGGTRINFIAGPLCCVFQSLFGLELGGDHQEAARWSRKRWGFNPCLGWNWGGTASNPPAESVTWLFQSLFGLELGGDTPPCDVTVRTHGHVSILVWVGIGGGRSINFIAGPLCCVVSILVWVGIGGGQARTFSNLSPDSDVSILVWVGIGGGPGRTRVASGIRGFNPCLGWNWGGT